MQGPGIGGTRQRAWRLCFGGAAAAVFVAMAVCMRGARGEADDGALCLKAPEAPEQAIAHCSAALALPALADDERSAILTRRGLAYFGQRNLARAAADFDAAIAVNGNSSWAYNSRAVVWMQKGEVDRALADYDSAIRLKPDYAFALANRGNAWLVKGDPDRALADLDRAAALAPPRAELVFTGRGKAWLAKGDYQRAGDQFAAALQANPRYANALSGRGFVRFCQGSFDAAADDFAQERQLRRDAESTIAWIMARRRGGHDASGELAEATRQYAKDQGMPAGLALFSGALTPQQAVQSSGDPDPQARRERSCAANLQVGEWYLVQSDATHARRHLQVARDTCDMSQPEYAAAGAELARLAHK